MKIFGYLFLGILILFREWKEGRIRVYGGVVEMGLISGLGL